MGIQETIFSTVDQLMPELLEIADFLHENPDIAADPPVRKRMIATARSIFFGPNARKVDISREDHDKPYHDMSNELRKQSNLGRGNKAIPPNPHAKTEAAAAPATAAAAPATPATPPAPADTWTADEQVWLPTLCRL